MTVSDDHLRWFREGEALVLGLVDALSDDDLAGPSLLPGWSRAHVVAHLARNADALGNLLHWAASGEVTPMYTSMEQRADGIDASAGQPPAALRTDVVDASERLQRAVRELEPEAWDTEIRTASARAIPASQVPWMRVRESWMHAVDLDAGTSFADQPGDVVAALLEELATWPSLASADPPLRVVTDDLDRSWLLGEGDGIEVRGPAAAVLTWISGRGDGADLATSDPSDHPPRPPAWL